MKYVHIYSPVVQEGQYFYPLFLYHGKLCRRSNHFPLIHMLHVYALQNIMHTVQCFNLSFLFYATNLTVIIGKTPKVADKSTTNPKTLPPNPKIC